MTDGSRKTLLHVTTVPQTLLFFRGQIPFLRGRSWEVSGTSSATEMLDSVEHELEITIHAVDMERRISPVKDLIACVRMARLLKRIKPDVVHAHTPKGGLIGMLTSRLTRVGVRIYHVHGLAYAPGSGLRTQVLRLAEKVSCSLAEEVICVSHSLRQRLVEERIIRAGQAKVLRSGSISGVDAEHRFNPERHSGEVVRRGSGIPPEALVVGYVGRIVKSKGIDELVQAFLKLKADFPSLHLLLVGPLEQTDPPAAETQRLIRTEPSIHLAGRVSNPAPHLAALDVLVLPSYREGFGLAAIEASAMKVPVVATDIIGIRDAVVDGVTGVLVPPRHVGALVGAISRYLQNPKLRELHGAQGRDRVLAEFRPHEMWESLLEVYVNTLAHSTRPV